ncbi:H-NS family nucleoid-associated regulatory protein [Marinobacterium mangrovicola]|uniref:DNA-binding protein H-NS n=1 Tax=Marinobacterium mangrovicola TaxID=1476959 RepID=A0A4V2PGD4_9GAMM|nr:H-NS histone family protein [Marinobacterium mangrovicola]TCK16416.1 DNA-binding protein H-NS [Marinobacterium mangrovicola]
MDFISTLRRKNSLRKAVKDLDSAQLEKVVSDLFDILEHAKAIEAYKEYEEQARIAAIHDIQRKMIEAGLSLKDFADLNESNSHPKVKPKYRLIGSDGKPNEWSGRGRKPVVFRDYEERGGNIEDLKII